MKSELYSRDLVEDCKGNLSELAQRPRTSFTKRQVFDELFDEIVEALKVRSYDEIAEMFRAGGLDVSGNSVKFYLSKCRRERGQSRTRRKRATKETEKSIAKADRPSANKKRGATSAAKKIAKKTVKRVNKRTQ